MDLNNWRNKWKKRNRETGQKNNVHRKRINQLVKKVGYGGKQNKAPEVIFCATHYGHKCTKILPTVGTGYRYCVTFNWNLFCMDSLQLSYLVFDYDVTQFFIYSFRHSKITKQDLENTYMLKNMITTH
jgi:hypothetical protein